MIAVIDRPDLTEARAQLVGIARGVETGAEHIVRRLGDAADAVLRPLNRQSGNRRAGGRPRIAHQRPVNRMTIGSGKAHAAGPRQSPQEGRGIKPLHQCTGNRRAHRGKSRMRMHCHGRKRKGTGKAGRHLIAHRQTMQHLFAGQIMRFGLGQQGRQHIGSCMAGREAVAFVQFAPGGGHAIGGCRLQTFDLQGLRTKDGGLVSLGFAGGALAGGCHFRLLRGGDHRTEIIEQDQCSTGADGIGQRRGRGRHCPIAQGYERDCGTGAKIAAVVGRSV